LWNVVDRGKSADVDRAQNRAPTTKASSAITCDESVAGNERDGDIMPRAPTETPKLLNGFGMAPRMHRDRGQEATMDLGRCAQMAGMMIWLSAGVGCGHSAAGDPTDVSGKADGVGTVLNPGQIADVGTLGPSVSLKYSGAQRYTGGRLQLKMGQLVGITNEIDAQMRPVVVVADAALTELVRVVGTNANGAPSTSLATVQFPVPKDGTYWLLYGEASRTTVTLNATYDILVGAGAACVDETDKGLHCYSGSCDEEHCAQSSPRFPCLVPEDCTSGKCGTDLKCEFLNLGDACQHPLDCTTTLCTGGVCSCVPKGEKPSDPLKPEECCSSATILDTCA
jgi:hypothetical protein